MENKISLYDSVISDIKDIIFAGRESVYNVANKAMILTYWNVGKRIVEEEQHGEYRAEYGKKLLSYLSDNLIEEFGKGFSERNLRNFRKFYLQFPDICKIHLLPDSEMYFQTYRLYCDFRQRNSHTRA